MNRTKIISIIVSCGLILSGCTSIQNDDTSLGTSKADTKAQVINDETTKNVTAADTTTINTTIQETTLTETLENIIDNTSTNTEDTSTDTTDTSASNNDTDITEYPDLVIPMKSTNETIGEDICKEVSEYFNSMKNVDIDTFKSKQLSSYNSYLEEYLTENESNLEDMLSTYNKNILLSSGKEDVEYTSCTFNNIQLDYPNDTDSILNTMTYIEQMDDLTTQYDNYTVSDELTAYYQLNYTIDYTLYGESAEDYHSTNSGSILVMDIDGTYYLVMLY